ncbi:hypothetical protein [Streptomyces buecherae]|uniref:Uncharacterized protein n=1 Tax=Streptomyces buecherae TaxID=2763006 RepID=A0A7H8NF82_9ACTN|nr:hypothetical protein [Streptomyces buecherae]QKW53102.1 hypothetical protein HUT08_30165 [Streptomyces buecherae]
MSHSQVAPPLGGHPQPLPDTRRPALLPAPLVSSALAALSWLFGSILAFAGGKDKAETNVRLDTLVARAGMVAFFAGCALIATPLARKAAT